MWQEIIVALIVLGALLYVGNRYLPHPWKKKKGVGCGSSDDGCGGCGGCATESKPVAPPSDGPLRRVITLHPQR